MVEWVPNWIDPSLVLPVFVLAAATNSVFEEAFWRGILADQLGQGWVAALTIATCFGLSHYLALPNGMYGVALTFAFSLIASGLRRISLGSLVPAVIVHFVADLWMFSLTS